MNKLKLTAIMIAAILLYLYTNSCAKTEYAECTGYLVKVVKIDTVFRYDGYKQRIWWQVNSQFDNEVIIEYSNDTIALGTINRILLKK